jgi:toxin-antitoxin system PIN domain toxin
MPVSLLDVNVLVALLTEDSVYHSAAQQWFLMNARKGWATCPFTQTGFVRIVCNPSASRNVIRPAQAVEVLEESLRHAGHEFWRDDLSVAEATAPFQSHLSGHQQITDAYLLGLTYRKKGRLVTSDKAIASLAADAGLGNLVTTIAR